MKGTGMRSMLATAKQVFAKFMPTHKPSEENYTPQVTPKYIPVEAAANFSAPYASTIVATMPNSFFKIAIYLVMRSCINAAKVSFLSSVVGLV